MTVIYRPSEVRKKLNLGDSLFKKYVHELEERGYVFQRNSRGHRFYTDKDILVLEFFLELIRYDGYTIKKGAEEIGNLFGHDVITEGESQKKEQKYDVMTLVNNVVEQALEIQKKQMINEFKEYLSETHKQLERIELQADERDKLLMQTIRETQETKKLLLEIKDQVAVSKENRIKNWFWHKFFKFK